MKLTKRLLGSLIKEAMEEANCRANELGEMNCAGKRDDSVLEEEGGEDAAKDAEDAKKEKNNENY